MLSDLPLFEWSHVGRVALHDFGEGYNQRLRHTLTGESCELDGRQQLSFSGGFAFVTPADEGDGREPAWANSLFDMSIHNPGDKRGDATAFLWYKSSGKNVALAEHSQSVSPRAYVVDAPGAGVYRGELYRHDMPKTSLACQSFFVLPWVQNFLLGKEGGSTWASRNYDRWVGALRSLRGGGGGSRPMQRPTVATADNPATSGMHVLLVSVGVEA